MESVDVNKLEEILSELKEILALIELQSKEDKKTEIDEKVFFDEIRKSLFKKLTQGQIDGIKAKLTIFREMGFPLSWAAYTLATSFHETARRMQPVREGLNSSDAWRKRNLRYYPWYGRGDVQLTWEANYKKADQKLHLDGALVRNPDLALDSDISAKVLCLGMKEGWFTGRTLGDCFSEDKGTLPQFKSARKIVNGTDKDDLIADYGIKFQEALSLAKYGEE